MAVGSACRLVSFGRASPLPSLLARPLANASNEAVRANEPEAECRQSAIDSSPPLTCQAKPPLQLFA